MPVLMSTPSPTRVMSSSMCSPAERLRLRPWLEKMIEEEGIPGLEWLDEQSRIVKIPWKHAARHGWTRDKDASLFKEWAIHTKKYDPTTDEPKANPKIWKANFRCAINSLPDIEELKDQGKTKGNDAFKVYRLNPKKPKKIRTVSDTAVVRKPKCLKNTKPRTKPLNRTIPRPPETSSQLSITCDTVSLNVIGTPCSQPPTYESVVRGRPEFRLSSLQQHRPGLPNHTAMTDCCPLPPVGSFTSLHHINSRVPPLPIPSTPHSTVSSPMSTPMSTPVSSPVFTYPPTTCTPFMRGILPSPLNIKQELPGSYNDEVMSESSGNMTDEELVDMVDGMRDDSPLNSPLAASPTPTLDSSLSSNNNEWMTSTLDDKQYFSNVVTSKVEHATTSSFQSSMDYPPSTSISASYCEFQPHAIKEESKPERTPCMRGQFHNPYDEGNVNGFAI